MTLPVEAAHADPSAGPSTREVLVIDDSPLIREAAKVALGAIGGWRIVTAASGEEGIERAISECFDAVLLDVVMTGMDGLAVAERLHGIPARDSLPIILLTAHDRLQDSERFRGLRLAGQVAGVIAKPFDIRDLSREVGELLGWSA
jgi:CheY-like chemotaxis protein